MLSVITAIMNIVFTIFAVYGIFVFRKWHKIAVEIDAMLIEMQNDLKEDNKNSKEDNKKG